MSATVARPFGGGLARLACAVLGHAHHPRVFGRGLAWSCSRCGRVEPFGHYH